MLGDYSKPTFSPGQTLTAAEMQAIVDKISEMDSHLGNIGYIKKASNEIVNNSSVMQDDNDLNISFLDAQAGIYRIDMTAYAKGHAGAGIKLKWVVSGGVTALNYKTLFGMSSLAAYDPRDTQITLECLPIASDSVYSTNNTYVQTIKERFFITVTAAGTVKLQWAQSTAHASDMIVYADSYVDIAKITAW